MNCALLPRPECTVKVAVLGLSLDRRTTDTWEGTAMAHLRRMVSYLLKPVIIFLLMVSPVSFQMSVSPAAARASAASCPAGYWRYASLCLNNSTGDVVLAATVLGQDYPTRPITLIVPLVAGSGVDTTARILAERMKTTLGQPLVVENIPIGAGVVGVGRLAEAAPDGYTIGIGDQTTNVISALTSSVRYDVLKDFEPISLLSTSPGVLVGNNKLQPRDLRELIAWLQANPDKATVASFGQGSGPYVLSVTFQSLIGTKLRIVPYRGNAAALPDLVSGQIDLMFSEQSNIMGNLRAGTIKGYAILAKERSAALPEIPTIEEAGGPPLHSVTWRGMWVPKGTPAHVTSRLGSAVVQALSDAAVQKRIAEIGQEVVPPDQRTPQALAVHHKAELEKWTPMIKAASIKAD
jgi:tripartite-type tricarboxylate transporter receptor subunit TctC